MKAFDEWIKELEDAQNLTRCQIECTYTLEDVWRAALKFVKGNYVKTIWNKHDLDFIDKELEEAENESTN